MAVPHLLSFALVSITIIMIHPSHSSADTDIPKISAMEKPLKVNLSLYYESLCPYCRNFIINQLVKIFNSDLISIVNVRMVPWGNAQVAESNKIIICQHGEDECYLNTIHACAINIWPDLREHFNFIYCVENQGLHIQDNQHSQDAEAAWKACSAWLGLDQKLIEDCYNGGYGKKLSLQYASETSNLNPQHSYVPWVTVNKQPLYDDYPNFIAHICNAYSGKSVVEACTSNSSITADKENSIHPVCYAS
ncbi:hypothetical protein SLE2022_105790 [Rubroshorea leprosula]